MNDALNALKQALAREKLSPAEVTARLSALIDAEYEKPTPDTAFIQACEALLREAHGAAAPAPVSARYVQAIRQQTQAGQQPSAWQIALRSAAALAAAVLVILLCQGIHFQWVEERISPSGEQHVFHGHGFSIHLIRQAIADAGTEEVHLATRNPAEVEEALGFLPAIPRAEALGAASLRYSVSIMPDALLDLTVQYTDEDGAGIAIYSITYYVDPEEFYFSVEQSAEGEAVSVDGVEVYCTDNLARRTYVWTVDTTISYILSGYLDDETAFAIVREIMQQ